MSFRWRRGQSAALPHRNYSAETIKPEKDNALFCRRTLIAYIIGLTALSFSSPGMAIERQPISVVATFSILGDMVKRIGGEHIVVTTLVGPGGDAHVFQPTPAAARDVSEADILIVNGLGFEGWLDRLIDASDFNGIRVAATQGIEPLAYEEGGHHEEGEGHKDEAHGENAHKASDGHEDHAEEEKKHGHGAYDPHAWQNLSNAVHYVDAITAALAQVDPAQAGDFYRNRASYVAEINALDAEIRAIVANLPASRRTVVTSHDAFQYFGLDYGIRFLAPQGLSTESEASAQDVARMIRQIRHDGVAAVFLEDVGDGRLLQRIADETGAAIGGILYPGALSGPDGPAATYLDMMRHNANTISAGLSPDHPLNIR
jgi:zinc/manganese transport system substrate-binding protein